MADDKISNGPNARPKDETIAGAGPGIPDDAATPGKDLPDPPTEEQERNIREQLDAPKDEEDTLPLPGQ